MLHIASSFVSWIPIFGALMWFTALLGLLLAWVCDGKPRYSSMTAEASIAFISDIGAQRLKPLFITACVTTAISFIVSLGIERYFRHSGRLPPNMRTRERVLNALSFMFGVVGGVGLILLSIFDTAKHTNLHRIFLLLFIAGIGFSAIFTVVERLWISHDYQYVSELRVSYLMKAVIAGLLILLAIVFGILLFTVDTTDPGAILEWMIGFGFTLYVLTFYYDLRLTKMLQSNRF